MSEDWDKINGNIFHIIIFWLFFYDQIRIPKSKKYWCLGSFLFQMEKICQKPQIQTFLSGVAVMSLPCLIILMLQTYLKGTVETLQYSISLVSPLRPVFWLKTTFFSRQFYHLAIISRPQIHH